PAHFRMQQPDRVGRAVVGTERVGADELGEPVGLVRRRHARGAHLVQHRRHAAGGELPRGLAAGETGADDMDGMDHARDMSALPAGIKAARISVKRDLNENTAPGSVPGPRTRRIVMARARIVLLAGALALAVGTPAAAQNIATAYVV